MNIESKTLCKWVGAIALGLSAHTAMAAPVTFFGADAEFATVNSDNAFAAWELAVGSYTMDNLDGMTGGGFGGSLTSTLGNTFTTTDDLIAPQNFTFTVLEGLSVRLTKQGSLTDFVWDMAVPSDSFGFFSRGNDGGLVTISFDDGTAQMFDFTGASSVSRGDNFFWGISGLDAVISSVSITSTDPGTTTNGGNSNWDRFVYSTSSTTAVNAPATLAFVLAGFGVVALRKRTK